MKYLILITSLVLMASCHSHNILTLTESDLEGVKLNFKNQEICWNKGDLDCYLNAYKDSDDVKTISRSGITYGKDNILEQYQKHFPPGQMGKLHFDEFIFQKLSPKHIYAVGRFNLKLADRKEMHRGWFSVILEKQNGEWFMISDHSS